MLTVAGLIERLKTMEQDRVVIIAEDADGSFFSPWDATTTEYYVAESDEHGAIGPGGEPAVVLWPASPGGR